MINKIRSCIRNFLKNTKKSTKVEPKIPYEEIFVSSGEPFYTYNPRAEIGLEETIHNATKIRKLTVVYGLSKSGKTVLVRKVLPKEKVIWIDGGSVNNEEEFWDVLVAKLQLFQSDRRGGSFEKYSNNSIKSKAGIKTPFYETNFETTIKKGSKREVYRDNTQQIHSKTCVLQYLDGKKVPVVIDDFHFIPIEMRNRIIKSFKGLIFSGLPLFVITVPSRKRDVFKVSSEMTGRIESIKVPPWTDEELAYIPRIGFKKLGHTISTWQLNRLTSQSLGSPHLMQEFCYEICKNNLYEESKQDMISISPEVFEEVFTTVAENLGRRIFGELVKITDNFVNEDRRRVVHDTVLKCIARMNRVSPHLDPLSLSDLYKITKLSYSALDIKYDELIASIEDLSQVATTDDSSIPVIEYDVRHKELYITDPLFAFYVNTNFRHQN